MSYISRKINTRQCWCTVCTSFDCNRHTAYCFGIFHLCRYRSGREFDSVRRHEPLQRSFCSARRAAVGSLHETFATARVSTATRHRFCGRAMLRRLRQVVASGEEERSRCSVATFTSAASSRQLSLLKCSGGFRGGPSGLRHLPLGRGTEAVTHGHVSEC